MSDEQKTALDSPSPTSAPTVEGRAAPVAERSHTRAQHAGGDAGSALPASTDIATNLGRWLHRHQRATQQPVGHMAYQAVRNVLAAVPYGIATAASWELFERAAQSVATKKGRIPQALHAIARSPVKDIFAIALGFTLFRGTLKIVRYMKERLFDPANTEQESIREVRDFGKNLRDTIAEVVPAEMNSTPYGAIALGMGPAILAGTQRYQPQTILNPGGRPAEAMIKAASLGKPAEAQQALWRWTKNGSFFPHISNWKEFTTKLFSTKSRPWTEAAVRIGGFWVFFELSDRLFKDVQVRRGLWNGEDNSLVRVSDKQAERIATQEKQEGLDQDEGHRATRHSGRHPELFGGDPNLGRLTLTRVASTVLGIGAYTLTKRAAYLLMGHFTSGTSFWKRALIEGAATSSFLVMTTANDLVEGLYKKAVLGAKTPDASEHNHPIHKLDQPLNAHQSEKMNALHERLLAKEQATGRAA